MVFNSVFFVTDYRESEFSYFVFDESVLTDGTAFDPGASLRISSGIDRTSNTWKDSGALDGEKNQYFGEIYPKKRRSINDTAEEILRGDWHKLDKSNCISLYSTTHCTGIRAYRNITLILRGSSGWNRSQIWNLSANQSSFWDAYVPKDVNNSLWFAHISKYSRYPCTMSPSFSRDDNNGSLISCKNDCGLEMGLDDRSSDTWSYPLFPNMKYRTELVSYSPAPELESLRLDVEYCLAEPFETVCQIGLASNFLAIVSIWYLIPPLFFLCDISSFKQEAMYTITNLL